MSTITSTTKSKESVVHTLNHNSMYVIFSVHICDKSIKRSVVHYAGEGGNGFLLTFSMPISLLRLAGLTVIDGTATQLELLAAGWAAGVGLTP